MTTTTVENVEDTNNLKNAFQIITTEEKSFTVYVDSPEEKEQWLNAISKYAAGGKGFHTLRLI